MFGDRIYVGESVTLFVDLDRSELDADYDLTGRELVYRLSEIGQSASVLKVTATVVDAEAGTAQIDLPAGDTSTLNPSPHAFQLSDDSGPLVLATGTIPVLSMIKDAV